MKFKKTFVLISLSLSLTSCRPFMGFLPQLGFGIGDTIGMVLNILVDKEIIPFICLPDARSFQYNNFAYVLTFNENDKLEDIEYCPLTYPSREKFKFFKEGDTIFSLVKLMGLPITVYDNGAYHYETKEANINVFFFGRKYGKLVCDQIMIEYKK